MYIRSGLLTICRFINAYSKVIRIYGDIRIEVCRLSAHKHYNTVKTWFLPFAFLDQDLKQLTQADKPLFCNKLSLLFMHIDDLLCKVAGNFDPLVATNFDPPEVKKYPVWISIKKSNQEGGNDERKTDKRSEDAEAGRAADTGYMPQGRYIT
jgi:hypothetical protein